MADIEFVKPHSLTVAKARALVQKTADALAAEYGLGSEWHGNTLHFHRSGVDGEMHSGRSPAASKPASAAARLSVS